MTAAELAEELEISVATARRDLEALSAAGIPVYPQRGRGGGWALLGGARTDLSGLSYPEMQALFLLVGPAAAVSPDAKAALRKLVRALPESFRAPAQAASDAVVVDASRWGDRPIVPAELLDTLRAAVVGRDTLLVGYRDKPPRELDPWGLVDKDGIWYLIAGTPHSADGDEVGALATRMQDAHLAYLATLHEQGHLMAAGPLGHDGFRGLSILRGSVDDVRALKEADPAVVAGRFHVVVMPWQVPAGAVHFTPTRFPHSIADVEGE